MSEAVTKNMREALAECLTYKSRGQQYFWRVASMKKLLELGYVKESYRGIEARRRYEPTAAGIAYLGRAEKPDA